VPLTQNGVGLNYYLNTPVRGIDWGAEESTVAQGPITGAGAA
jgi:hypothetical protein